MSVLEKTILRMYSAAGVEFKLIPLGLDYFSMSLSSTNMVSVSEDNTIFHTICALTRQDVPT
jgi:hypothetical protein